MIMKSVSTFLGTVGLSLGILDLRLSDNLKEIIVVLLSALIIALLQLAISFLKKLVDKSDIEEEDKKVIKDLLDKLEKQAKKDIEEKDNNERHKDDRPDNKSGPGD